MGRWSNGPSADAMVARYRVEAGLFGGKRWPIWREAVIMAGRSSNYGGKTKWLPAISIVEEL